MFLSHADCHRACRKRVLSCEAKIGCSSVREINSVESGRTQMMSSRSSRKSGDRRENTRDLPYFASREPSDKINLDNSPDSRDPRSADECPPPTSGHVSQFTALSIGSHPTVLLPFVSRI